MTARTRRYGEVGDILRSKGFSIQLLELRRVRLGDVAENHYIDEGCEDREEFVRIWNEIHPARGFVPTDRVWLHVFRYLEDV